VRIRSQKASRALASLINFDYNAGLYTVPKQLDNGYLTCGKIDLFRD
jgi:hypothetical protein